MRRFIAEMARSAILGALLFNLGGCLSSPERPDASAYGRSPQAYEQPAKDDVEGAP